MLKGIKVQNGEIKLSITERKWRFFNSESNFASNNNKKLVLCDLLQNFTCDERHMLKTFSDNQERKSLKKRTKDLQESRHT